MLLTNLLHYGRDVWLVTITAPGQDVLPWDAGGRRVVAAAAQEWNRTAPGRWSELHRRAQQAVARSGGEFRLLAYAWQLQERGVLHLHLVLAFGTPAEAAGARQYVAELRLRRAAHGFGFIDARDRDGRTGRATVMEPHRAAGYLSRYLTDSAQFVGAVQLRERPARLVYVSASLTLATGCIRRRLRRARLLWRIRNGTSVLLHAGRLPVWFRDPLELRAVASLLAAP